MEWRLREFLIPSSATLKKRMWYDNYLSAKTREKVYGGTTVTIGQMEDFHKEAIRAEARVEKAKFMLTHQGDNMTESEAFDDHYFSMKD